MIEETEKGGARERGQSRHSTTNLDRATEGDDFSEKAVRRRRLLFLAWASLEPSTFLELFLLRLGECISRFLRWHEKPNGKFPRFSLARSRCLYTRRLAVGVILAWQKEEWPCVRRLARSVNTSAVLLNVPTYRAPLLSASRNFAQFFLLEIYSRNYQRAQNRVSTGRFSYLERILW